ncbi:MAG: DUF5680 domain-containing protein [Candidatus Saccharibacteria bacterium]|nr:DUF5680 domain-containing protein [Candidatus Saccharibacteria bacterium]
MELEEFLIKAKKATYANASVEKVVASRRGSNDYEYSDNGMIYHDTYFGGTDFIGEEVVYDSGSEKPIWGMNYRGVTLDLNLSEEAIDKALRPALMKVGEDDALPVRGPKRFINDDYEYTFNVDGDLERFDGIEEIRKNGELIYQLRCTGGRIV